MVPAMKATVPAKEILNKNPARDCKNDLNVQVTILQGVTSYALQCGKQFGSEQG